MTVHQVLVQAAEQDPTMVVADICLYGIRQTGAGWLAVTKDGRAFGTGDPMKDRSFTEAVYQAVAAIEAAGTRAGLVRIFHPGGEFMTVVALGAVPNYGSMASVPVPEFGPVKADVALKAMADPAVQKIVAQMKALEPLDARD